MLSLNELPRPTPDFASKDPVLNPRMMVVVTELMKVLISIVAMVAAGESHLFAEVNLLRNPAVIPAVSYSLQNIFIYLAYFSLDPLVANILNPTKVVFTVCFSYVLLGRKTNLREVSALALLFAVIVVVKLDEELHQSDGSLMGRGSKIAFAADGFFYAMTASLLSGFGSATCELIMTPWKKSEEEAPATKSGSRGRVVSAGEAGVEQDNDAGRAQSPATDKRGKSSSAAPTRRAKSPTPVLSNGTGKGKRGVSPAGGSRMNKDVVTGELHQPSGVEKKKSGYLFSLELSFFTLSLTVLQIAGMSVLYDVQPLSWETHCPPLASMVPLMTQASGGIIVGQVQFGITIGSIFLV